ncbi:class I SAM-dependent methyltransferase [Bartonella koehlerae]|uniref:Methyltransferase type 11 domain-containing protein n=1 Tax=Bartonella koehlerae C-29 TaxID=1134510 RepID=A0A067W4I1_9HYPH|nr:hypothetical protein O9A_01238 [Bartonella koehlerae C-29]
MFSGFYTHEVEIILDSDVLHLFIGNTTFDLVILHRVLYFLESPEEVFHEIAGALRLHGRLLIVDFVRHEVEYLHSYLFSYAFWIFRFTNRTMALKCRIYSRENDLPSFAK